LNDDINILLLWYSEFNHLDIGRFSYPIDNIIEGLIVFLYQKYSTRKKERPKYFGINLSLNYFYFFLFLNKY